MVDGEGEGGPGVFILAVEPFVCTCERFSTTARLLEASSDAIAKVMK